MKLKWYRLLFTPAIGGAARTGFQIAREKEDLLESTTGFFLIGFDVRSAAWIALFLLVTGIFLTTTQIYDNIGRLGDPGFARAAWRHRVAFTINFLIGAASFAVMPDAAMNPGISQAAYRIENGVPLDETVPGQEFARGAAVEVADRAVIPAAGPGRLSDFRPGSLRLAVCEGTGRGSEPPGFRLPSRPLPAVPSEDPVSSDRVPGPKSLGPQFRSRFALTRP